MWLWNLVSFRLAEIDKFGLEDIAFKFGYEHHTNEIEFSSKVRKI